MKEEKQKIRMAISLGVILDLLTSMKMSTEVDGIEIEIYNPEIWGLSEEEDVEYIAKWRKKVEELSKLLDEHYINN